ncbi:hydroxyethylthiazole kinase [Arcanobacterium bovis]|uniref:Hydroxyethylthiazole kinase n=1 Tax=Arcanobacterium bovis TaxID=2529275 RepID=A0A4V2KR39_9ACTO|nr:hydroxyethylthiazole kinase [Arcanobacterium bovis]TBW22042.1 hydroxyethylthiazole kinase [Arcanobacterium bovis]
MTAQAQPTTSYFVNHAISTWNLIRSERPLIHCITNTVVQNFTANVLLATRSSPAMIDIPWEAGEFARYASASLINLGTLAPAQQISVHEAAASAQAHGRPWVLDPVGIGVLPVRTRIAHELLTYHPTCVRGNASEIIALAGGDSSGAGVDSRESVIAAQAYAEDLAAHHNTVVAVSGPCDVITDGDRTIFCSNGHEWQSIVTGSGCALGAFIAAFLAVEETSNLAAVVAAHICYGVAAERAAACSSGPGSFVPAFIDTLYSLDDDAIAAYAKVQ